jgi:hypothetical protein
MQKQRRDFLKLTTVGATSLLMGRASKARANWPSSGKLDINPTISNMLVVGCKDQAMLKSTPTSTAFTAINAVVDTARVHANLDAMAMRLANTTTADAAWKAIFRSGKPWASTIVAIKINVTETKNMPRIAVVEKLCRVIAGLGVPASNIIVYDGGPEAFSSNATNYASYFSTTDASKIPGVVSKVNDSLGGTTDATLPDGTTTPCTADIANGKVDILINIAINKGHIYYGKASMCMKNHYGTFKPNHDANYLFTINKSDALLGGTPPRQQLCIVDSLLANKTYNAAPEAMPYYLVMGTFAPAVDYLTVKKVREEVMNMTHDSAIIDSYMTTFGYTTKDPQWVLVAPASSTSDAGVGGAGGAGTGGNSGAAGTTGGTGSGGKSGAGGSTGSVGTGSGGASGGGATGSGGTHNVSAGGAGGNGSVANGSGGAVGSGGLSGSGGTTATAGSAGSSARGGSGSGGTTANSGAGGSAASVGGTGGTGAVASGSDKGCGCKVGGTGSPSWKPMLVVSAVVVGQLGRLLARRQAVGLEASRIDAPHATDAGRDHLESSESIDRDSTQ